MPDNNYGGVIWTNHALEKLEQRRLSKQWAFDAFKYPDKRLPGKLAGTVELLKYFGKSKVTVIAKQNDKYEWLILSCWIDPPFEGTVDYKRRQHYLRVQKASFWGKLWIEVKQQLHFLVTGKYY